MGLGWLVASPHPEVIQQVELPVLAIQARIRSPWQLAMTLAMHVLFSFIFTVFVS
jgi:hypothetical protein